MLLDIRQTGITLRLPLTKEVVMKLKLWFVCLAVLVGTGMAQPGFDPKEIVRQVSSNPRTLEPLRWWCCARHIVRLRSEKR